MHSYKCNLVRNMIQYVCYPPFAHQSEWPCHSLIRANGEVFVLLYVFFVCSLFCQQFLDNPRAYSSQILHAGVLWFRMCLLPFWGLAAPGGVEKGGNEIFVTIGVNGEFLHFERYLSNAQTNPHQILFVQGQCRPTCPFPLWGLLAPGGGWRGELKLK